MTLPKGHVLSVISAPLKALLARNRKIRQKKEFKKIMSSGDAKVKFTEIYKKNVWGNEESSSGDGSGLAYTENIRNALPQIIRKYAIKSIVDAPCGDFYWMKVVLPSVNVDYIGLDIVEDIICNNNKYYSKDGVKFYVSNICEDHIPLCDILMVRDCLFHFSFKDINLFLANFHKSDCKYLFTTTHLTAEGYINRDIATGDFRQINLFQKPFCFDSRLVLEAVDDYPTGYPLQRQMILLEKAAVPTELRF